MVENLAIGFSSESTQVELSNEYQYDRVRMVFKNLCVLVLWTKVALALEGLKGNTGIFLALYAWNTWIFPAPLGKGRAS